MLLSHSKHLPLPGGFSRNGVEKVWLHRSFLATLGCVDAVTRGAQAKTVKPSLRSCCGAASSTATASIEDFLKPRRPPGTPSRNLVAKRRLRLRRQLIAYKLLIIVDRVR
jgi:hypothetical protein